MARADLPHDWMLCFDPDQRITGDLRGSCAGSRKTNATR